MFKRADANKDGKITLQEFFYFLRVKNKGEKAYERAVIRDEYTDRVLISNATSFNLPDRLDKYPITLALVSLSTQ